MTSQHRGGRHKHHTPHTATNKQLKNVRVWLVSPSCPDIALATVSSPCCRCGYSAGWGPKSGPPSVQPTAATACTITDQNCFVPLDLSSSLCQFYIFASASEHRLGIHSEQYCSSTTDDAEAVCMLPCLLNSVSTCS